MRKTSSYILCIIVERVLDPSRGLGRQGRDCINQAIAPIAAFALDSAPEARLVVKPSI